MFKTRITEMLDIKYPIIQGSLGVLGSVSSPSAPWLSTRHAVEIPAAVSNAGGLGMVAAALCTSPEELRQVIRETKKLTDKPFGVNIPLFPRVVPVDNHAFIDVIAEEGVKVLVTAGLAPDAYVEHIKKTNLRWFQKGARVRDMKHAESVGAEAVIMIGFECGGHPSLDDVTSLINVPLSVDSVSVPVIAGGGFCDARGFVAALALGAEAVMMGTRFMLTKESPIHQNVKDWMLNATERDTITITRTINDYRRVMKNTAALRVRGMEQMSATLQEILPYTRGTAAAKLTFEGDLEVGTLSMGQCVALLNDVPTVQEVIENIVSGARKIRVVLGDD